MLNLKKTVASGVILLSMLCIPHAFAQEQEPSVIHVTGYAEQEITPDTALITIGMETVDSDINEARAKNTAVMNELTNSLKNVGIDKANLRTAGFSVNPRYDQTRKHITHYIVFNSLKVKITNLELMNDVLKSAARSGANKISNVQFSCSNTNAIKANLIKEAVNNGRQIAEAAVFSAGGQLGKIKEIHINGAGPIYISSHIDGARLMKAVNSNDDIPKLEAGTQKITEMVQLTFFID